MDKTHAAFRYVKKPYESQRKTRFLKSQKRLAKTLIKPVENKDFLSKIAKRLPNDQKSITFIDKTHMAFRNVENPYEHCRK